MVAPVASTSRVGTTPPAKTAPAAGARIASRARVLGGGPSARSIGIAFAVFLGVVIPVVFQVEEPATSLGVEPASILVALNGTDIASLPPETDMLDFISNADFPKTCVFRRPLLSL